MLSLSDDLRAGRQGPTAEALARLYRDLQEHHPNVSLPEFVRLAAILIDAAKGEDAR